MASSTVAAQAQNFGASINIISGIQGVAPGAQASINMPVNNRIHRETFQCSGIAYGLNGTPVATPTVAGTETFTVTVLNGIISAIAINNATSAKGAGTYTGTIVDPLYTALNGNSVRVGQGATFSYVVNGANTVTSVTLTSPGIVSFVPPELFFTAQKRLVNGVVIRDISAADSMRIYMANVGPTVRAPQDGELPICMTEPWRKIVDHDQATAWDLIGQSTYQILYTIASNITTPSLSGTYEFDYLRNARMNAKGEQVLFLRPIKQHTFSYNVPGGVYNVTSLPVDNPIQRMWLKETGKGSILQVELYQDGNKVLEGTYIQVDQMLEQYGFNAQVYDFSAVFDMDERLGKALKVDNLVFRVYSNAPTVLNITMEIQGNGYN